MYIMNNSCYMCGSTGIDIVEGSVRDNDKLLILKCKNCDLIFLSSFEHIKKDYYNDSHQHDDPLEYRTPIEYNEDDDRRFKYCKLWIENKKHLDFGCGEGGFLLKTQNITNISHGWELEDLPRNSLRKKSVKVFSSFKEMEGFEGFYDIITVFPADPPGVR